MQQLIKMASRFASDYIIISLVYCMDCTVEWQLKPLVIHSFIHLFISLCLLYISILWLFACALLIANLHVASVVWERVPSSEEQWWEFGCPFRNDLHLSLTGTNGVKLQHWDWSSPSQQDIQSLSEWILLFSLYAARKWVWPNCTMNVKI